eukprot:5090701-Amphidinium_carterae.2
MPSEKWKLSLLCLLLRRRTWIWRSSKDLRIAYWEKKRVGWKRNMLLPQRLQHPNPPLDAPAQS